MKSYHFILGYFLVGFFVGILQTLICIITGFVFFLISNVEFISFANILLLMVSQLPMLIINIFVGILLGTTFSDKTAPGISSVFISLSGIVGGCWMPVETIGAFELFCRFLPFYPSVYIGRIITNATNAIGINYTFNDIASLGFVAIILYMTISVVLSCVAFKKSMVSDK